MTDPVRTLESLVELSEKATPGPWQSEYERIGTYVRTVTERGRGDPIAQVIRGEKGHAAADDNARFIVAARNSIPALLATLAQNKALRDWILKAEHSESCETWKDEWDEDGYKFTGDNPCTCRLDELRQQLGDSQHG